MRSQVFAALLPGLVLPMLAVAEETRLVVLPDQVTWQDVGGGLELAVLVGDITKREPYVERVRFAPGAEFPLHTHPNTEVVTVLSGAFGSTFDSTDKAKGQVLGPGSVLVVPGGTAHHVWAGDEGAVVQVHGHRQAQALSGASCDARIVGRPEAHGRG